MNTLSMRCRTDIAFCHPSGALSEQALHPAFTEEQDVRRSRGAEGEQDDDDEFVGGYHRRRSQHPVTLRPDELRRMVKSWPLRLR